MLHLLLHRIKGKTVTNVLCFRLFRVVHGFTSCGMLESQYQGFAEAAKLGNVGDKYIDYGELWFICLEDNHCNHCRENP